MTNYPHQPPPGQPWPPPPHAASPGVPGAYPPGYPAQSPYGGHPPAAHPHAPVPALPAGPIGGTPRQWEARVRRMVRQGNTRDEILFTMRESGWPFDQAQEIVRRHTSKERWVAIWTMLGTGVFGLLGIVLLIAFFNHPDGNLFGAAFAFLGSGLTGFIYGLVRLAKIRA